MPLLDSTSSLQIVVGECKTENPTLQKLLHALYPQQTIQWISEPHLKKIDTYVLVYLCSYGVEELALIHKGIQRAQQLMESQQLKADAHILLLLYRDLKVAFPERKLQREKVMSDRLTEEILNQQDSSVKARIRVTHEFGTSNLKDSLQQLKGPYLYFELML